MLLDVSFKAMGLKNVHKANPTKTGLKNKEKLCVLYTYNKLHPSNLFQRNMHTFADAHVFPAEQVHLGSPDNPIL